jgi:HSP20 family molecular chaperone IbpA
MPKDLSFLFSDIDSFISNMGRNTSKKYLQYDYDNVDGNTVYSIEVPGFAKDKIELHQDDEKTLRLVLKGKDKDDRTYILDINEYKYDNSKTTSKLENGILYITIHKRDNKDGRARRVEIL